MKKKIDKIRKTVISSLKKLFGLKNEQFMTNYYLRY